MAKKPRTKTRAAAGPDIRVLAIAVALAAAAVAAWVLFTAPARAEAARLAEEIATTQARITTAQTKIAALRSGETSAATGLLAQARQLDAQLPASVDKVALAGQVPTLAESHGLVVEKMDPASDAKTGAGVGSLSFTMSVTGPNASVVEFLRALQGDNPVGLMTIDGLSLTASENATTASFTLTAFHATTPTLDDAQGGGTGDQYGGQGEPVNPPPAVDPEP